VASDVAGMEGPHITRILRHIQAMDAGRDLLPGRSVEDVELQINFAPPWAERSAQVRAMRVVPSMRSLR
jgi:hypothetical protein